MYSEDAELLATSASYIHILLKDGRIEVVVEGEVDSFVPDGSEV